MNQCIKIERNWLIVEILINVFAIYLHFSKGESLNLIIHEKKIRTNTNDSSWIVVHNFTTNC